MAIIKDYFKRNIIMTFLHSFRMYDLVLFMMGREHIFIEEKD